MPEKKIVVKIEPASDRPSLWWSIEVDGHPHGGGWEKTESAALDAASAYLKDKGR
jgi:hypothetical protein